MLRTKLILPGLAIALAGGAFAQSDDCSTATAIGTTGSFAFDTSLNTTSLFDGGGTCVGADNVVFDTFYQWTAPSAGDFVFDTETSTFDTQLSIHSGIGCAATCLDHDDDGGTGLLSNIRLNGVLAGDTFLVQVGGYPGGQGIGSLNINPYVDPCAGAPDDAFEDNDDCFTASPITAGSYSGLFVSYSDLDFYSIVVPAGDVLDVDLVASTFNIDFNVYDGTCTLILSPFDDWSYTNTSGAAETIVFEALANAFNSQDCANYDLDITLTTPPPPPANNDCSTATALAGTGTFPYDTTSASSSLFDGGGTCAAGSATNNQDIFYQWTVPATADYQFDTDTSSYDTKLSIHAGVGCAATCVDYDDDGGIGLQSLIQLNGLVMGDTYLIQVGGYGANFGAGVLNISTYVDPCTGVADDTFEDNDDCSTAATMATGYHAGLFLSNTDSDSYAITIPAGDILTVDLFLNSGDVDFAVYDSTCFFLSNEFGTFTYANITGVPETIILEVTNDQFTGLNCADYDLDISTAPDPCQGGMDDTYEENDDCSTAAAVGDGTIAGLFVSKSDQDHYSTCVADGATIDIDILFLTAQADLDLFLWDASDVNCGTGFGTTDLANGFSTSDNESVSWTNLTGASVDLVIEVNVWTGSGGDCNNYDLVVSGSDCSGGINAGTPFCDPGSNNSTGVPAVLAGTWASGVGSDLHLEITDGVPGQLAYFLCGNEATMGIPVSNGLFCLVGTATAQFFRFNVSGTNMNSIGGFDATGTMINAAGTSTTGFGFDVPTTIPDSVPIVIMAGDTWHFQGWYRDTPAGVGSSNFTNGLSVTFP